MTLQDQEIIKETLRSILQHMDITAEITIEVAPEATVIFNVATPDSGMLIGARGASLGALQYLARVLSFKKLSEPARFVVDVEGYRKHREEFLRELGRQAAARVRETGEALILKPMPPYERRIVHDELGKLSDVATESRGEDPERRVLIRLRVSGDAGKPGQGEN